MENNPHVYTARRRDRAKVISSVDLLTLELVAQLFTVL